jgi:hypothetical protein
MVGKIFHIQFLGTPYFLIEKSTSRLRMEPIISSIAVEHCNPYTMFRYKCSRKLLETIEKYIEDLVIHIFSRHFLYLSREIARLIINLGLIVRSGWLLTLIYRWD